MSLADSSFPALSGHYSAGRNLVSWGLGPLNFSVPLSVFNPAAMAQTPVLGLVSSTPGFLALTALPSLLELETKELEPTTESTEPEYIVCSSEVELEGSDKPSVHTADTKASSFSTCDPNPDDDETPGAESKTPDYSTEE